jgi:hypothetical protein
MNGISITDILKTEKKISSSRLPKFLSDRANQFYSKKMLMKEGFSSNITTQLKELIDENKLWVLSTNDQDNDKNRKNVNYYSYIDEKLLTLEELEELKFRCLQKDEIEETQEVEVKTPKKKKSKST